MGHVNFDLGGEILGEFPFFNFGNYFFFGGVDFVPFCGGLCM